MINRFTVHLLAIASLSERKTCARQGSEMTNVSIFPTNSTQDIWSGTKIAWQRAIKTL